MTCRGFALLLSVLNGCAAEQPPEQRADPSLAALTRLAEQDDSTGGPSSLESCLTTARRSAACPTGVWNRRSFPLRIALDHRYAEHWPNWQERMQTTMDCVNRLFSEVGTSWTVQSIATWDPSANRHNLRALLRRLQNEYPPDLRSVVVGISLWDERRIYAQSGGEIGLSQHAACVVPSWPRVENDCLTLAHELGHIVGARHVPGKPGKQYIMGWAGHTFHLPATDAVRRVVTTHSFDPRNIEVMRIYQNASFTMHGLALPAGCAERIDMLDRCWRL